MNNQYATNNTQNSKSDVNAVLEIADCDLKDELAKRLSQKDFYGTISLQINFRSGKYNWHRITSEYTRGAGNTK